MTTDQPVSPWVHELRLFLPFITQFVINGNVHDMHLDAKGFLRTTEEVLIDSFMAEGFDLLYTYDAVDGITLTYERTAGMAEGFFPSSHLGKSTGATVGKLADLIKRAVRKDVRVAVIVRSAPRLWRDESSPGPELRSLLAVAENLAVETEEPAGAADGQSAVAVVWLAGRGGEAPLWLSEGHRVRTISIPRPELSARRRAARLILGDQAPGVTALADVSQGLRIVDLLDIARLAGDSAGDPLAIDEAARCLRVGVSESPWGDPQLLRRIAAGESAIDRRVLGQEVAVRQSLDVLLRSAMGMTGIQSASRSGSRPQGVLFFAGPTGVGKTELAKALAELLFGSADAYIRFDMSEFSAEHSEARLIGAPPGYIGFAAGGELTNAVRERPFSLLLFDEIEKAHPRILDKFLQVLEDGRLTDGKGSTVYFSEAVIVFTSNLGTSRRATEGSSNGVQPAQWGDRYDVVQQKVRAAIERHFTEELARPELLNRIGLDNIIVFDYISEAVGRNLTKRYVDTVVKRVQDFHDVTITMAPSVLEVILQACLSNLEFGGRGVGATVESSFVNPLARALAQHHGGATDFHIIGLRQQHGVWSLEADQWTDRHNLKSR